MKFNDILFLIATGGKMAAIASSNPMLATSVDAGVRLMQIGRDAFESGRERKEWTLEQEAHFDEVVIPTITSQAHWKNRPVAAASNPS